MSRVLVPLLRLRDIVKQKTLGTDPQGLGVLNLVDLQGRFCVSPDVDTPVHYACHRGTCRYRSASLAPSTRPKKETGQRGLMVSPSVRIVSAGSWARQLRLGVLRLPRRSEIYLDYDGSNSELQTYKSTNGPASIDYAVASSLPCIQI